MNDGSSRCVRGFQITAAQFLELEIHKSSQAAISDVLGYKNMTRVQEQSIPICLTGTVLVVIPYDVI